MTRNLQPAVMADRGQRNIVVYRHFVVGEAEELANGQLAHL